MTYPVLRRSLLALGSGLGASSLLGGAETFFQQGRQGLRDTARWVVRWLRAAC
jgi:hypothetical protein